MINVKELNVNYIEEIKSLFVDIFTNEPWNDDWSDSIQLHEYIMDLIGNRNSLTLGLFEKDELIGLSMGSIIHWYTGTEYYINEFCIKAGTRGKGIGTEFLKAVEQYIKNKQVTHIFLQTERTVPAYKFYKKNDFVEMKDHVSFYKEFR
jgi:aminoglycoside 6'-N-acetyltransferase I